MGDAAALSFEARAAAIGGTRQMIHEDEFRVLVALLVDCGAVPKQVMAIALEGLAGQLIAKAHGKLETEFVIYPAEIFDRARGLSDVAMRLRAS